MLPVTNSGIFRKKQDMRFYRKNNYEYYRTFEFNFHISFLKNQNWIMEGHSVSVLSHGVIFFLIVKPFPLDNEKELVWLPPW